MALSPLGLPARSSRGAVSLRMLLSGYYGFGNFGDEALLAVTVQQLRLRFPSAKLDVLSATPNATARAFGVEATPRWEWRATLVPRR